MEIITGYRGEPHVSSQQERNAYIAIFGGAVTILKDIDSELEATVISANEIQVSDGMLVAEGCTACIERGTSDSLAIENGSQGMQRIDLIVARYTRNAGTAVEDMQLAVIKGTPSATDPAVPAHTTGLIADGDPVVDFPLYRVNISGISITSVERLVEVTSVAALITALQGAVTELQGTVTELQDTVSNTKLMVVNAPLGTLTFNSAGAAGGTISVAQYIPAGYTMIGAIPAASGYFGAYFYTCAGASATSVYVQLMRISGTQASTTPVVKLLCAKNL